MMQTMLLKTLAIASAPVLAAAMTPVAAEQAPVAYQCDDVGHVEARFGNERVKLTLPDGATTLAQLPSGSGARYGNDEIEFWIKGEEALLTRTTSTGPVERACRVATSKTDGASYSLDD